MSGDPQPTSTEVSSSTDPVLSSVSLAAFAATTIGVPRPASMTLDVARHHAFTGEIAFAVEPTVRVYLDGGVVYHAERDGEVTVSQALLDGGIIDAQQLERGMVRVGDVEHLGRLFERDATIDRDAVMVVVEHHTDLVVSHLANFAVAPVSISAYRHHPSGLHRWFAAPIESAGRSTRPVSEVAQIDRSVVEEIPDLGRAAEGIIIEWDEPDPGGLGYPADTSRVSTPPSDFDVQAELDQFDADHADWAMAPSSAFVAPNPTVMASPLGEFHIVWPDGTAEDALASGTPGDDAVDIALLPSSSPVTEHDSDDSLAWPVVVAPPADASFESTPVAPLVSDALPAVDVPRELPVVPTDLAPPTQAAATEPLHVDHLPGPDAAVPDDVAAAVRRALQAIDEASLRRDVPRSRGPISLPRLEMPAFTARQLASTVEPHIELQPPTQPSSQPLVEPPVQPSTPTENAPAAPVGFAPPTMDMRAEVMYAQQAEAEASSVDDDQFTMVPEAGPREPGKASVVFVDEQPADTTERRGALRRLIKSLRNGTD